MPLFGRFAVHAVASGLLTNEQVTAFESTLDESGQANDETLARGLVREGLLTRWQAAKIWAGRTTGFFAGQYKLLDLLGEGGMGKVYRAEHTFMRREVALKVLPPSKIRHRQTMARFVREVHATAALTHPNIVTVFDAGQHGKIVYMAMELVRGMNLAEFVKARGRMDVPSAVDVVVHVAEALDHAHRTGIVHRDIKPQNIMLSDQGAVKVLDMGLVRLLDMEGERPGDAPGVRDDDLVTADGQVCGTLAFIAPEQARNAGAADIRSDIYSLGCTFYYLLSGVHAFAGKTPSEILTRKILSGPRPIEELVSEIPPNLAAVVMRMMAKQAEDRYPNPRELLAALQPWCDSAAPKLVIAGADADATLDWLKPSEPSPADPEDPLAWLGSEESLPVARPSESSDAAASETSAGRSSESTALDGGDDRSDPDAGDEGRPLVGKRYLLAAALVLSLGSVFVLAHDWGGSRDDSVDPAETPPVAVARSVEAPPATLMNGIGMKFVLVPAGEFAMGSGATTLNTRPEEQPSRSVTISRPFYLSIHEVTQLQFSSVIDDNPSYYEAADRPVERVRYEDAVEFCRRLGEEEGVTYRLPTEAEWEYSCRAGTTSAWSFGARPGSMRHHGWCRRNTFYTGTRTVGSLDPNPWGLFDMHGNVAEWCSDWYGAEQDPNGSLVDPTDPSEGDLRVVRGGDCMAPVLQCRSAARVGRLPDTTSALIGFRVVRELRPGSDSTPLQEASRRISTGK